MPDSSGKINQPGVLKRRVHQTLALLWVALGVVVFLQSLDLEYMSEYGPGPGLLPFWLGVAIIILGFVLLAQITFGRTGDEDVTLPDRHAARQMCLIMVCFFGFVFLAQKIGFLLCVGLLFFFLLLLVERQGWKFSLVTSIVSAFAFWAVFELWLELRLPPGLLAIFR